jgi:CheY-specific phosphatase CheX
MKDLSKETIQDLVSHILETMAFVLVEPSDEAVRPEELHHARISFYGPEESTDILLSASEGFLLELASSMLGMEPEEIDPGVEGVQALSELANVVCGEVVLSLGGETDVFSQGIPESLDKPDEVAENASQIETTLDSEGEPLRVRLSRTEA